MPDSLLRILLVESSMVDARIIDAMLAASWEDGLTLDRQALVVKHVRQLGEAIELLGEMRFDLILLDLFLPDGEGLGVFTRLHEQASDTATVILTAINDRAMALNAVRLGAQDYLVKSQLNVETLGHSLSHALERHVMVHELQEHRRELEASERRLRTIIATNTDGLMVLDQGGFVRFANAAAAKLYGIDSEELQGTYLGRPAEIGQMMEIGIVGGADAQAMAAMRAVPIEWEGAEALLVSVRDITERVRSQAAIQSAYREKEQLISAIASILVGISSDGRITTWNRGAENVFGQSAEQVVGRRLAECPIDWDVQKVVDGMRECQLTHRPVRVDDVPFTRPNGRPGFLGMTLNPIKDTQSDQRGALLVGRDITEPKKMRAELEQVRQRQLRMKDQFLSHVSHELRTPLYAIYQFVSILQDGLAGELNEEQQEYLGIISKNTDQLQTMIGELLDLTRVQTGKLGIEQQETDLYDLIEEITYTMRHKGASKHLNITHEMASDLPPIYADPTRVREILSNLIDNAIKFTPQDGTITTRVVVDQNNPGYLQCSVTDTGVGISPDEREAIFNHLYQGTEASEFSRKGMGIGLYLCKELVTRQGGQIWVESEQGRGSTFFFTLPMMQHAVAVAP